jgi:glycosyltransferase involved in cell wall biosynthesis
MVQHLGFDSATCHPLNSEGARAERTALRRRLGFAPDDLVVINTGKLNSQRNGLLLAQTVGRLRAKGLPFRGLFIGCGSQSTAITACDGCTVLPLMPASELPAWYRAADIAWWPHPTISIVDSAACGLPLLVGSAIDDQWFLTRNGLRYRHDDPSDLGEKLCEMASLTRRTAMGALSASMMHPAQSWDSFARTRLRDYETALCGDRSFGMVPAAHEQGGGEMPAMTPQSPRVAR